MNKNFSLVLSMLFFFIVTPLSVAQEKPSATEIIELSDKIRNPSGSYLMNATITEYNNGKISDEMTVTIHSKPDENSGMYRTLVEIRNPEKDRGKLILRNSQDLWFYDPNSKASVRISPQQRLLGQVSNGDVMSSNFSKDYHSRLVGEETIRDATKIEQDCYFLELESNNERVTYPKIEYWVSKEDFYPIKGKFYSDSGRLLKVAYYRGFKAVLGSIRPTEVLIIDSIDSKKISRMRFSEYDYFDIPDFWFQRSWLPRHVGQ